MTREEVEKQLNVAMAESKAARQEAIDYLTLNGEKIDLGEWVTLKEYARRYHLKSTNVISNWISRGVIPVEKCASYQRSQ